MQDPLKLHCRRPPSPSYLSPRRLEPVLNSTKAVSLVAITLILATSACDAAPASTGSDAVAHPTQCALLRGGGQHDVDPEDTPEKPWPHRRDGAEVIVGFETGGLSGRYEKLVREAASIWSVSPCIQAIAVEECEAGGNCVSVEERFSARDRGTDGEFRGRGAGPFRTGGTITLYTGLLDRSSDNGALATVVHEMGHALGLVHRGNRETVMNAETDDKTNAVPDAVDFTNLVVIYGAPAAAPSG